jgi:tyrosyl-tRNA synthetase
MLGRCLRHVHRARCAAALCSQGSCSHSSAATAAAAGASQRDAEAVVARLYERELLKDCTDSEALTRLLTRSRGSVKAYLGFDPTAPSLHVGHLIGLRLLLQLQTAGLPAIALVGGVTAVIGDPSGRSSARTALSPEEVQRNAQRLHIMLLRLLQDTCETNDGPVVLDNSAWLEDLRVTDLLTGAGRHMRIGAMLGKENVRTRLVPGASGLSFAEFAYPLLQGYDWVHLARAHNCRVQIGGSDQWGNLVDGAGLVRHMLDGEERRASGATAGQPESDIVGVTCPLLVDSTGAKLGKSGGNAVWLDADLTSPYELYQYFRRLDAATAHTLLKQLTDVPLGEAAELAQQQEANAGGAAAAEKLAEEVVSWVHGAEAAAAAVNATAALYSSSSVVGTNDAGSDARGAAAALANALVVGGGGGGATAHLPRADVVGAQLLDVCALSGLTKSKGEARRLLTAGGLSCNEQRCDPKADAKRLITDADLLQIDACQSGSESGSAASETSSVLLLRAGKKKHLLITLT